MKTKFSPAHSSIRKNSHLVPSDFKSLRGVFRSSRIDIGKRAFKRTLAQLQKEIEVYNLRRYINRSLKREIQRTLKKEHVQ